MGAFGMWELLIIFGIVLLLFGAKRLPGIASGLGGAVNNFKRSMREGKDDVESSAEGDQKIDADKGDKVPEQIAEKQAQASTSASS